MVKFLTLKEQRATIAKLEKIKLAGIVRCNEGRYQIEGPMSESNLSATNGMLEGIAKDGRAQEVHFHSASMSHRRDKKFGFLYHTVSIPDEALDMEKLDAAVLRKEHPFVARIQAQREQGCDLRGV